ncbi:receptor-like protein kinase HSL1 isoform X2 [Argentina anserina]|uniref:receptor-like protein kinase HSL1 isoform X2 n=1 Tax=Argentina anserina TaxID=57926 RepID=UPI0021762D1E|nr:receptor-like protein kinase HSL1 isoform X2 [Potentilla anserina]
MIFHKEDLDLLLVPSAILILFVYIVITSCRQGNDPHATKREWVKRIMKVDTKEGLAVISSRIQETYACGAACLMIFPVAWLANSSSFVFQRKLVYGNSSPELISIKFECLISCFLLAMAFYGYSAKQFKQTIHLISSKNKQAEARAVRAYVAACTFFSLGMRFLQCAGTLLLWFFGPIPMFVSSIVLVIFLHVSEMITSPPKHIHPQSAVENHGENSDLERMCFRKWKASIQTQSLDEDNVIGSWSSGKVYKVSLNDGQAIAVKKLVREKKVCKSGDVEKGWDSDDGFEAEVATLEKIKHKNIMKLLDSFTTRDFKFLIYEYMPNGSLGDLLHSSKAGLLDWPRRCKIARDAAEGLCYLHHDCDPAIVHRDVKSNNILLDADFGARLADFRVAKIVDALDKGPKSMSVIKGSPGHIAQDNAYERRAKNSNVKGDIYCFGVVILELVTGKHPGDPDCGKKGLAKWVRTTLKQKGEEHVIDPKLDSCHLEEICRVLDIGIYCTKRLPFSRPSMTKVVKLIQQVSEEKNPKIAKKEA